MFGLELEAVVTIASAVGGWLMRMQANNQQLLKDQMTYNMEASQRNNENQNAAKERNSTKASFLQRYAAIVIIGTVMGGLLLVAFFSDVPTVLETTKTSKKFLFGILEFGGGTKFTEVNGFVIPAFVKQSVLAIIGFLFGSSVGKLR